MQLPEEEIDHQSIHAIVKSINDGGFTTGEKIEEFDKAIAPYAEAERKIIRASPLP